MSATLAGMRVIALAALAVSLVPAAALAGKPVAAKPAAASAKPAGTATPKPVSTPEPAISSGMEGRTPTDVLRFETLVIEGRVQTPGAVHVKDRSDVSFSELVTEESLLPKILDAVESEPF